MGTGDTGGHPLIPMKILQTRLARAAKPVKREGVMREVLTFHVFTHHDGRVLGLRWLGKPFALMSTLFSKQRIEPGMTSADKQVLKERYAKYITAWKERYRQEQAELLARAGRVL